jgi:hypothetical protein
MSIANWFGLGNNALTTTTTTTTTAPSPLMEQTLQAQLQMQTQQQQFNQQMAMQQMAMQQSNHTNPYQQGWTDPSGMFGAGGPSTLGGTGIGQQNWAPSPSQMIQPIPRDFRQVQTTSDLDHAVFKTPVEDLVNIWLAKFGNDWVDKTEVLNDEFFEWAAMRLRNVGRLEEHTIWNAQDPANAAIPGRKVVLRIVDK